MDRKSRYNWSMVFILTAFPVIGIFGTLIYVSMYGVAYFEPILLVFFWLMSGLGITMGYHRLFAHKSYKTNVFLEWVLMIFGSIALENTILKWASDHRKHHSLSDTEKDPYSITKGFWHAHIGLIMKNTDEDNNKIVGVKDLAKKSAITFQNKYYYHIAFVGGFLVPLCIGFIYGRPLGAILWGTFLRITLVHHATFLINSLCHYTGSRTYDFFSTARDSWFVSLFTFGEGYHNYHHKFPSDFRNGIRWFAFDPSKWLISILSFFKLTRNLIRTSDSLIFRSKFDAIYDRLKKNLDNTSDYPKDLRIRIEKLLDSANETFQNWQNIEVCNVNIYSEKEKQFIKFYKSKFREIFKDLGNIEREMRVIS